MTSTNAINNGSRVYVRNFASCCISKRIFLYGEEMQGKTDESAYLCTSYSQ